MGLLGAIYGPCACGTDGFTITKHSSTARELAAIAATLLLVDGTDELYSGTLRWVTDSECALDVVTLKARASANTHLAHATRQLWTTWVRTDRATVTHINSHQGHPANECADVLANLGMRGAVSKDGLLADLRT